MFLILKNEEEVYYLFKKMLSLPRSQIFPPESKVCLKCHRATASLICETFSSS